MLARSRIALDRSPGWTFDRDGRLRVAESTISKSSVNEYLGSEIPDNDRLGLNPNKLYRVWRRPDELEKAAGSFNGLPLMARHVPTTAADHKHMDTVGTTGTSARFVDPYLKNGLTIWTADAIRGVENGSCRELSCAYAYKPVMRSGRTPAGEAYDIEMHGLEGNHVALVERGRVGPEAVVGDGAIDLYSRTNFPNRDRLKTDFDTRYPDAAQIRIMR